MLTIELKVNSVLIDEIHIQRIDGGDLGGWCEYAIRKPAIPGVVRHYRPAGAVALMAAVGGALAEAGYGRRDGQDK